MFLRTATQLANSTSTCWCVQQAVHTADSSSFMEEDKKLEATDVVGPQRFLSPLSGHPVGNWVSVLLSWVVRRRCCGLEKQGGQV